MAFSTLLFGLFASVIYSKAIEIGEHGGLKGEVWGGILAFFGAAFVGGLWRKIGRPIYSFALRKSGLSFSNDDPSALATLFADTKHDVGQIAVRLDDGRWLRCDDTRPFASCPFGPCVIGPEGDVALYLTHVDESDGTSRPQTTVLDQKYGDRIVYVPASRITEITMRHIKRSSNRA